MADPPPIDASRHALFLDFDGTLVRLVDDPDAVAIEPAALKRLEALRTELSGALAIVSGRRIADLDRFLEPLVFAAAGVHGLERRVEAGGEVRQLAGPDVLQSVRDRLGLQLEREKRLRLEDKGTALVLHYRTVPELKSEAERVMTAATGGRDDLVVMHGDMIVEAHPAGMDKGRALADMMAKAPFAGRVPVYVGDDTTDEFALRHVREAGGVSIKVGKAESAAEFRLADVDAVHRWLGVGG